MATSMRKGRARPRLSLALQPFFESGLTNPEGVSNLGFGEIRFLDRGQNALSQILGKRLHIINIPHFTIDSGEIRSSSCFACNAEACVPNVMALPDHNSLTHSLISSNIPIVSFLRMIGEPAAKANCRGEIRIG